MPRTRAERRHHHQRMRQRTENFLDFKFYKEFDAQAFDHQVCRRTETRKPCSCEMCGNPRKHWKERTLQEKIADLRGQDDE